MQIIVDKSQHPCTEESLHFILDNHSANYYIGSMRATYPALHPVDTAASIRGYKRILALSEYQQSFIDPDLLQEARSFNARVQKLLENG